MQLALSLAEQSPPQPTNYRVGALLLKLDDNSISSSGFTLELPGNTHAEECCLAKLARRYAIDEDKLGDVIKEPHALFTTVEPCSKRLSGKMPCVERILRQRTWIQTVFVGVQEPSTFVAENCGRAMLEGAGIKVRHVTGLEEAILKVATTGHTPR